MDIEIDEGIRSVLVLEDEAMVALMMEDLLRGMGVKDVHVCSDTASALRLLHDMPIDCAVLDLRVRDGSSLPVADALLARDIPFVFSTGSDTGALDIRFRERPMLSKPFADDDFKLIVLDTWSLRRPPQGVSEGVAGRVATSLPSD